MKEMEIMKKIDRFTNLTSLGGGGGGIILSLFSLL